MIIERLELLGFTTHDHTTIALPARGLTLVTGANGSGKSSLAEATSWGLWGRTLRGAHPWREGGPCKVSLCARVGGRLLEVERRRTEGGKGFLNWAIDGQADAWESPTKAQEALEAVVGGWDVWRRACAFSSSDAAHFTLASDGERKLLLEQVLGLGIMEAALDACRRDLRAAEQRVEGARRRCEVAKARAEGAAKRLADAGAAAEPPPATPAPGRVARLRDLLRSSRADADAEQAAEREYARRRGRLDAEARAAAERARLLAAQRCPTCHQEIGAELRNSLTTAVAQAETEARALTPPPPGEAGEEAQRLAALLATAEAQARAAEEARARAQRTAAVRAAAETEERAARAAADVAAAEAAAAGAEAAMLRACEAALGLRGIRAEVLGRALAGIEDAANGWLARIAGPGLALRLAPYTERKTGSVTSAISLEVVGAGGGRGYRACSGGQRRRIDLALMLALSDVAGAALGLGGSTLWIDEAADALDADGTAAVASAVEQVAETRSVVLITHSEQIRRALTAARHLRVTDGRVEIAA